MEYILTSCCPFFSSSFFFLPLAWIFFAAPETVSAILPTTGPTSGNTVVTVTGTGFQDVFARPDHFARLTCVFGSPPPSSISVNATLVSSSELKCISPSHTAGSVTVRIANNNQDFTLNPVVFIFQGMSHRMREEIMAIMSACLLTYFGFFSLCLIVCGCCCCCCC
jgi:hypothetical protein